MPIAQPSVPLDTLFKHAVGHTALPLYTSRHCLRSTINYTYNQVVVQPSFATNEESPYTISSVYMYVYVRVYVYICIYTYIRGLTCIHTVSMYLSHMAHIFVPLSCLHFTKVVAPPSIATKAKTRMIKVVVHMQTHLTTTLPHISHIYSTK